MSKKAEEKKDTTKVAKGVVNTEEKKTETTQQMNQENVKKLLDEKLPDMDKDPKNFASNIARYGHFKNPTTKKYSDEQLGMALDLHRDAQRISPNIVPNEAKLNKKDVVL